MALPENEAEEVKGPIGKYFTVDQKLAVFDKAERQTRRLAAVPLRHPQNCLCRC